MICQLTPEPLSESILVADVTLDAACVSTRGMFVVAIRVSVAGAEGALKLTLLTFALAFAFGEGPLAGAVPVTRGCCPCAGLPHGRACPGIAEIILQSFFGSG